MFNKGVSMRLASTMAAAAALAAGPASAVVTVGSLSGGTALTNGGSFVILAVPPASIAIGTFGDFNVYAFDEKANYTLLANLGVDVGPTPILAGTAVSSHLVFINPPSAPGGAATTATGTVTFDRRVRGIITAGYKINASSPTLGNPATVYGVLSGLETSDFVSFAGNTVTFSFVAFPKNPDFIRVLTVVPEPATWAMLISGFGLVGFASRRRRNAIAS